MRARTFLFTTLLVLCHLQLWSQAVTRQFPPVTPAELSSVQASGPAQNSDAPDEPAPADSIPVAHVVPTPPTGVPVKIEAETQSYVKTPTANLYTLVGQVVIHYRDYVIQSDRATYNQATSEVVAEGHLHLDGGPDDAHFLASHGTMNLDAHTGHFYDVAGTLEGQRLKLNQKILNSTSPFAVTARELIQTGPKQYHVIDGAVTSCALPNPDWQLAAKDFFLASGKATGKNSLFELRGLPVLHRVPVFYLPYVTHPVDGAQRESGFLIPVFGDDTTKGLILGEEIYFTLGRSADFLLGSEYFSRRGFAPLGMFRYKGRGLDFATVKVHSLLDRLPAIRTRAAWIFWPTAGTTSP